MKVRRPGVSSALVGLLGVLTVGAAWLGIVEAPSGVAARWATFLANTAAAGSFAFATTTSGSPSGVAVTLGVVDLVARNEIALTVVRSSPPQRYEVLVVNGIAYERASAGPPVGPAFIGPWLRVPTASGVFPFGGLTGTAFAAFSGPPAQLKPLGRTDLRGIATTEYQIASSVISCPGVVGGRPRFETSRSRIWVDRDDRIRQFENDSTERFVHLGPGGPSTMRFTTITAFGGFGTPVNVSVPTKVARMPLPAAPTTSRGRPPNPLAGCTVTQR